MTSRNTAPDLQRAVVGRGEQAAAVARLERERPHGRLMRTRPGERVHAVPLVAAESGLLADRGAEQSNRVVVAARGEQLRSDNKRAYNVRFDTFVDELRKTENECELVRGRRNIWVRVHNASHTGT